MKHISKQKKNMTVDLRSAYHVKFNTHSSTKLVIPGPVRKELSTWYWWTFVHSASTGILMSVEIIFSLKKRPSTVTWHNYMWHCQRSFYFSYILPCHCDFESGLLSWKGRKVEGVSLWVELCVETSLGYLSIRHYIAYID